MLLLEGVVIGLEVVVRLVEVLLGVLSVLSVLGVPSILSVPYAPWFRRVGLSTHFPVPFRAQLDIGRSDVGFCPRCVI